MRWSVVLAVILILIVGFSYLITLFGPVEPLGRLSFVKLENPDMFPGHPHSTLLAQYAEQRGSKCALVLHFAGSSRYSSYLEENDRSHKEDNVYIIEVAFIDTQGGGSTSLNQINILDSLNVALFGVPDGRYKYMSDGVVYDTYDGMMNHVYKDGQGNTVNRVQFQWFTMELYEQITQSLPRAVDSRCTSKY